MTKATGTGNKIIGSAPLTYDQNMHKVVCTLSVFHFVETLNRILTSMHLKYDYR